jgi:N-acetylglutamate synthase/N-acetylornithine aminotransferase
LAKNLSQSVNYLKSQISKRDKRDCKIKDLIFASTGVIGEELSRRKDKELSSRFR